MKSSDIGWSPQAGKVREICIEEIVLERMFRNEWNMEVRGGAFRLNNKCTQV